MPGYTGGKKMEIFHWLAGVETGWSALTPLDMEVEPLLFKVIVVSQFI